MSGADEVAKSCAFCDHASGENCLRDQREGKPPFTQAYERKYTDLDFCGPSARFFTPRAFDLAFIRDVTKGKANG